MCVSAWERQIHLGIAEQVPLAVARQSRAGEVGGSDDQGVVSILLVEKEALEVRRWRELSGGILAGVVEAGKEYPQLQSRNMFLDVIQVVRVVEVIHCRGQELQRTAGVDEFLKGAYKQIEHAPRAEGGGDSTGARIAKFATNDVYCALLRLRTAQDA